MFTMGTVKFNISIILIVLDYDVVGLDGRL